MVVRRGLSLAVVALVAALSACGGSSKGKVQLSVQPVNGLVDEPVTIQVSGASPGSRVTLVATTKDYPGNLWRSSATFAADQQGAVDVTRDPSLAGTYTGRDAMGLFWSMREVGSKVPVDQQFMTTLPNVLQVTLGAEVNGRTVASTTLHRQVVSPTVRLQHESVAKQGFAGCFWSPRHPQGSKPAVLEFGGSEGGLACGLGLLAAHGYPVLHIGYFGLPGLPQQLEKIPLEYFARALRWLAKQPGVDPRRIVIWGVSRGAEAAILTAAAYPSLVHAAVESIGSAFAGAANGPGGNAAWTVGGRPIPVATKLPVWKVNGPVLLIGGDKDALTASGYAAQNMAAELRAHGRHDFTVLEYKHAGHSLSSGLAYVPTGTTVNGGTPGGGTYAGNAQARADSWQKLLAFLGRL